MCVHACTSTLLLCMCYLDGGLHLHVCACSDDDGDQVEISIFRKYRNKLNHLIEKSKVNYYMQQIASSNNNSSLKPFNDHQSHYSGSMFFCYNSPAATAR